MTQEFGLHLLHRHDHLDVGQAVIKDNESSTILNEQMMLCGLDDYQCHNHYLAPTTWALSEKKAVPIELSIFGPGMFMRQAEIPLFRNQI